MAKCPSIHKWSGLQCIRAAGHEGMCWGKATRGVCGTITRAVWRSIGGVFRSHHTYETRYPSSAKRGVR